MAVSSSLHNVTFLNQEYLEPYKLQPLNHSAAKLHRVHALWGFWEESGILYEYQLDIILSLNTLFSAQWTNRFILLTLLGISACVHILFFHCSFDPHKKLNVLVCIVKSFPKFDSDNSISLETFPAPLEAHIESIKLMCSVQIALRAGPHKKVSLWFGQKPYVSRLLDMLKICWKNCSGPVDTL